VQILMDFIKSVHDREVSLVLYVLNDDEIEDFDFLPKVEVYLGDRIIGELYDLSRLDILEGYIEKALGMRHVLKTRISHQVVRPRYLR